MSNFGQGVQTYGTTLRETMYENVTPHDDVLLPAVLILD